MQSGTGDRFCLSASPRRNNTIPPRSSPRRARPRGVGRSLRTGRREVSASMQCLACGAEMHPREAVGDDSNPAFEHRTFTCSVCGDVERRLLPRTQVTVRHADPTVFLKASTLSSPLLADAPPISPGRCMPDNDGAAASAFVQRLFAKMHFVRDAVRYRKAPPVIPDSAGQSAHTPDAVFETRLEPIPELTSASFLQVGPEPLPALPPISQTDKNKDECERLLRTAIAMVQSTMRSSEIAAPQVEPRSATPEHRLP